MRIQEKVPQYFTEFNKGFNEFKKDIKKEFNKIDERFEKIEGKLEKVDENMDKINVSMSEVQSKLKEIIENQEIHFEAIGEMKVQITNIESTLSNKANQVYVDGIDNRVQKLEKAVFA